jgi:dolichyl-phosphate-mannose-protein mannosyltransferase
MKKHHTFGGFNISLTLYFLVHLLTAYLPLTADEPEINLVINGDFEQPLTHGWQKDIFGDGGTIDSAGYNVHSGSTAIRIFSGPRPNDVRLVQLIPVEPETYYRLSSWIATENVESGKVGANICLMGGYEYAGNIDGTKEWQYVEMYFRTSKTHRDVRIGVRLGMYHSVVQGSAFFDDVRLVKVDSIPSSCFYLKDQEHGATNQNRTENKETRKKEHKEILVHNINLKLIMLLIAIGLGVIGLNILFTFLRDKKHARTE